MNRRHLGLIAIFTVLFSLTRFLSASAEKSFISSVSSSSALGSKMNPKTGLTADSVPSDKSLSAQPLSAQPLSAQPLSTKPMVFFDLGEVLIDTHDSRHLQFMPGAETYLQNMHAAGFRLGLITNVPESWGSTTDEKIEHLKGFVAQNWSGPREFPWAMFEQIHVPPRDELRKPHPHMFLQARSDLDPCRPIFHGEEPNEVESAKNAGFVGHWTRGSGSPTFAPLETLTCFPARQTASTSR